jgi:hypothetical protein
VTLSHGSHKLKHYSTWKHIIEKFIVLREDGRHAVGSQRTRTPWRLFPRGLHAYNGSMPGVHLVACSRRANQGLTQYLSFAI